MKTIDLASKMRTYRYDYDATGIRVSARHRIDADGDGSYESDTQTLYLVDHRNFTGYQQVVRETHRDGITGEVEKVVDYTFGTDEISQTVETYDEQGQPVRRTDYFLHDGHGSVRVLTDAAGAVAQLAGAGTAALHQVYVFDAYGNALNQAARHAATVLLYSGEQWDARLGQQYLRARYYDAGTGHFNRLDPFFGNLEDPQSLHKYGYVHSDPVNMTDPSGESAIMSLLSAIRDGLNYTALHAGRAAAALAPLGLLMQKLAVVGFLLGAVIEALEDPRGQRATGTGQDLMELSLLIGVATTGLVTGGEPVGRIIAPLRRGRGKIKLFTGTSANIRFTQTRVNHLGKTPGEPAYDISKPAAQGQIAKGTRLVRLVGPNSRRQAEWVMPRSEVEGLTPQQLKDKFALPKLPTGYVEVRADGVEARVGYASPLFGGEGGSVQIHLLQHGEEFPARAATFGQIIPLPQNGIAR